MTKFAKILGEILKDHEYSQMEFAKRLGCCQSQVHNWLTGKTVPGYHYIIAMCKHLNVTADYLLGLESC